MKELTVQVRARHNVHKQVCLLEPDEPDIIILNGNLGTNPVLGRLPLWDFRFVGLHNLYRILTLRLSPLASMICGCVYVCKI